MQFKYICQFVHPHFRKKMCYGVECVNVAFFWRYCKAHPLYLLHLLWTGKYCVMEVNRLKTLGFVTTNWHILCKLSVRLPMVTKQRKMFLCQPRPSNLRCSSFIWRPISADLSTECGTGGLLLAFRRAEACALRRPLDSSRGPGQSNCTRANRMGRYSTEFWESSLISRWSVQQT